MVIAVAKLQSIKFKKKNLGKLACLLLLNFNVFSQYAIDEFPQNLQLYPRNAQNIGIVRVVGTIYEENDKLSLVILKNNNPYQILEKDIVYNIYHEFHF